MYKDDIIYMVMEPASKFALGLPVNVTISNLWMMGAQLTNKHTKFRL
jgi:hypothetical protein